MICYYIDASAWVKRYYQETGSNWINILFKENNKFACSPLGYIEVLATLSRKRKNNDISITDFHTKANELKSEWSGFIEVNFDQYTISEAENFLNNHSLKGADTVHLSSAIILKNHPSFVNVNLIFVSSDDDLSNAATLQGFTVINPENFP